MSYTLTHVLSLAGSATAAVSLASGEGLRDEGEAARRARPRMLLSLVLLGAAVVAGTAELAAGGALPHLGLLLLAAGAGLTYRAYRAAPPRRDEESPRRRFTRPGLVAVGVLAAAEFVLFGGDRLLPAGAVSSGNLQAAAGQAVGALNALGVVAVAAATILAAALFRSRGPVAPGDGFGWRRLTPLARKALGAQALALAVVGLAGALSADPGTFTALTLLLLGAGAGVAALLHGPRPDAPAPWGVSPRGWVSLVLLALAGLSLASREVSLLWPPAASARQADGTSVAGPVTDPPSVWSLWLKPPLEDAADPPVRPRRSGGSYRYGEIDLSKGIPGRH
jgi:hypothetical protein